MTKMVAIHKKGKYAKKQLNMHSKTVDIEVWYVLYRTIASTKSKCV